MTIFYIILNLILSKYQTDHVGSNAHMTTLVIQTNKWKHTYTSKRVRVRKLYLTSDSVNSKTLALTWNEC